MEYYELAKTLLPIYTSVGIILSALVLIFGFIGGLFMDNPKGNPQKSFWKHVLVVIVICIVLAGSVKGSRMLFDQMNYLYSILAGLPIPLFILYIIYIFIRDSLKYKTPQVK